MKIVHIITRLILGGAQENTLITCELLAQRGHDVTLITGPAIGPEGQLFDRAQNAGYNVIVVDSLVRQINPLKDLAAYLKIKKHLKTLAPDIVHTHSAKAGILGRFAGFSLKSKKRGNKPIVLHTIHGLAFHEYQNKLLSKFYIAIEKATAKKTDAFLSVADTMNEKAKAAGIGTDKEYTTAYSAIEEDNFLNDPTEIEINDFRRKLGINEQATVIVCISRLAELKGHEFIIESAKTLSGRHENCIWLFVGAGHLEEQIKEQIRLAGLAYKFKFAGMIDPDQVPMAIHASDILVHCSLREGLARVLPQAMLCGKPAISFDIDGAKEVVNQDTGRLIDAEDTEAFTAACEELINDPALRKTLGQNGREQCKQKFAPNTMVDTIETVYNKLTNNL